MLLGACILFFLGYPLILGVPESEFPFPYLNRPLVLVASLGVLRLWMNKKRPFIKKIEKSVLVTEKKFDGLYVVK